MRDDCAKMARPRVRRGREGALSAVRRLAVFAGAVCFGGMFPLPSPALESYQRYQEETGLPAWKSSLHFTVFARDQETAGKALDELEKTHRRVTEDLNLSKDMSKQCLVFIWPKKSEYIKRADQFYSGDIEATLGFFILVKESEPATMYFYESDKMLKEVLPHELSHLILEIVLDPLQKYRIPLWLHEGFAQAHEEGDYRQNLLSVMVAQRRGKLLPLGRILTTRGYPDDSLSMRLFYLESEALVRFLLVSQSRPGEFFDFCTEVLFWKKDPEKILPKRFGGAFPDADILQEKMLDWVDKQSQGVSFAEDNTFLQPQRRFEAARRHLEKCRKQETEGEFKEAQSSCELAQGELELLKGEDPEWNRAAARRLGDEIKAGLDRVREALAAARGDNELLRRFSLERPFNFTDRQAREAFGESSSLGKIKLSKMSSDQENDRFGITFARYNDQGVHFIFRRGETIGVFVFEPFAGDMYGVKIGDPKEAVLDTLRRRCGIKKPGNPTKNWWVDLPDREIELIFTDARLSGIQVHKKDPLGRRYRWVGY